jgi:hypothetical protein
LQPALQEQPQCNFSKILALKTSQLSWFFLFLEYKTKTMKKLLIPIIFVAIIVGLFEQSKDKPNIYILCAAVAVFMFGMMQLSSIVPSKSKGEEKEEEDVE